MTNPPAPPVSPNYNANSGARLTTDRFAFQQHVDGYTFRHHAGSIDLVPSVTLGAATLTDVQTAIAALAGSTSVPVVPDATTISKGLIQLGGDLGGVGTTAAAPKVGGLQGFPISNTAPSATGQVLTWNGSAWAPALGNTATTSQPGTVQLAGDLGGTGTSATSPKVSGLQGFPILNTTPTSNQVLTWNGSAWAPAAAGGTPQATAATQGTIQLSGDLGGSGSSATTPRVGGINGATVPAAGALTTGHVLQVTGTSALTYGFVADANVSATAAIAGSKINPNFGSQSLTAGVSSLGATTTGTLTAGLTTSFNTITGGLALTTRTITTNLIVDTTFSDHVIFVNTNSALQITLPTPTNGRRLIIKDIIGLASINNITLVPHSTEKIEGLAGNKVIGNNWGSWTLVSNGTDWFLV